MTAENNIPPHNTNENPGDGERPAPGAPSGRQTVRRLYRLLRHLVASGAYVAVLEDGRYGIYTPRGKQPVTVFSEAIMDVMRHRDILIPAVAAPRAPAWQIGAVGVAFYRRLQAIRDGYDPWHAQHMALAPAACTDSGATIPQAGETDLVSKRTRISARPLVNQAESPLAWLARRRGPDGHFLLTEQQYDAGERLRRDFTMAGLTPRMTVDWSLPVRQGRRAGPGAETDAMLDARDRLNRALAAAGPGLSDVLLEVCCYLNGLEMSEQRLGWPRRSAKVVLLIALDRLVDHYETPRRAGSAAMAFSASA